MNMPLGYLNGQFVDVARLNLAVNDPGVVNGAMVSEQTRTFCGQIFELERHLDRFWRGLEILRIDAYFDREQLTAHLLELVELNRMLLDKSDDFGLCFFVTPGQIGLDDSTASLDGHDSDSGHPDSNTEQSNRPAIRAHAYRLPFGRWSARYASGFDLVRSSYHEVPQACWPKSIKCRSRMHYYLAELEAHEKLPGAKPILTDAGGNVRDSSIASLIFLDEQSGLFTPGGSGTLDSISVQVVKEIAAELGIAFQEKDVPYDSVHSFSEVMLATTPWCLAPVASIDGRQVTESPGPVFQQLIEGWSERVGMDIVKQADQFSHCD